MFLAGGDFSRASEKIDRRDGPSAMRRHTHEGGWPYRLRRPFTGEERADDILGRENRTAAPASRGGGKRDLLLLREASQAFLTARSRAAALPPWTTRPV